MKYFLWTYYMIYKGYRNSHGPMQTLSFKSRSNSWWNGSPTVSTLEVTLKPGFPLREQKDDGHGVRYIWDEKEGWTHVLGYRSQCKVPAHLLRQACLFQILCLGKPQTQTVLYTLLLVLILLLTILNICACIEGPQLALQTFHHCHCDQWAVGGCIEVFSRLKFWRIKLEIGQLGRH